MESDPHKRLQQELAHGEQLNRELAYRTARAERLAPLFKEQARLEIGLNLAEVRLKTFQQIEEHNTEMEALRAQLRDTKRRRAELNGETWVGDEDLRGARIQKTPEQIQAETTLSDTRASLDVVREEIARAEDASRREFDID